MPPLVSVVIPTFNDAPDLARAIAGVRAQQGIDTEILVVNDASTDATSAILARLVGDDPHLKIFHHNARRGASAARNTALRQASGDYIALLDSDDQWHPEKISLQIAAVEQSGMRDRLFCLTYFRFMESDGSYTIPRFMAAGSPHDRRRIPLSEQPDLVRLPDAEITREIIIGHMSFGTGSTLLASREAMHRNGLFDETIRYGEDADFLMRHLLKGGEVKVLPQILMTYKTPEGVPEPEAVAHFNDHVLHNLLPAMEQRWGHDLLKETKMHLERGNEIIAAQRRALSENPDRPIDQNGLNLGPPPVVN